MSEVYPYYWYLKTYTTNLVAFDLLHKLIQINCYLGVTTVQFELDVLYLKKKKFICGNCRSGTTLFPSRAVNFEHLGYVFNFHVWFHLKIYFFLVEVRTLWWWLKWKTGVIQNFKSLLLNMWNVNIYTYYLLDV